MQLRMPPIELVPPGLRAMKMVALANGALTEKEIALIDAVQAMLGTSYPIDELAPITPEELAAAVVDPHLRRQLVYGMLLLALADGEASPQEARMIEAFRRALGVDAHEVATFHELSEGHRWMARFEVMRRFWVRPHMVQRVIEGGAVWFADALAVMGGLYDDTRLAKKYRALLDHPEDSFGRAYARFIVANEFSFPGERGSPPEPIVYHDLMHVLSGYGTKPADEICVTAFSAGVKRDDPFTFLLFSMMQFNPGIAMTPAAAPEKNQFDPPRVIEALRRGARVNTDLTLTSWRYWDDFALPLETVRAKYGVPPLGLNPADDGARSSAEAA